MALAIGLEGKMTATTAGDALKALLQAIVKRLGDYPHEELDISNRKKQTTRMMKVECSDICCGFSFRASRKQIAEIDFNKGCLAKGCNGDLRLVIE